MARLLKDYECNGQMSARSDLKHSVSMTGPYFLQSVHFVAMLEEQMVEIRKGS